MHDTFTQDTFMHDTFIHDTLFKNAFGEFQLQRRPAVAGLKAWDGADDYLLELAAAHTAQTALVINDNFGALSCALHTVNPASWTDSYTAHLATQENIARNQLPGQFSAIPSTTTPDGFFDLVVWRVPKSLSLFEQQIARLQPLLKPETIILAGGMDKHLLPDTKTLLERLGRVTTLPGKKKSHVFQIAVDTTLPAPCEPKTNQLTLTECNLTLSGDAAVFARDRIDIGARFFIEQFSQLPAAQRIADLGCGNGLLSLALAKQLAKSPQDVAAEIHLFDESYQAVNAAKINWQNNIGTPNPSHFHIDDGLSNYDGEPFDLILCNPPFHQQHVVGDHIARQLFMQSKQHLRKGGELWIVGNRHLDYHLTLKKLFGNCRQIATNSKFVVLMARA